MRDDKSNQVAFCTQFIEGKTNIQLEDGVRNTDKLIVNAELPYKKAIAMLRTDQGHKLNTEYRLLYAADPSELRKELASNNYEISEFVAKIVSLRNRNEIAQFSLMRSETIFLQFKIIKDRLLEELSNRLARARKDNESNFGAFPDF
jgi:hypothetical protein